MVLHPTVLGFVSATNVDDVAHKTMHFIGI